MSERRKRTRRKKHHSQYVGIALAVSILLAGTLIGVYVNTNRKQEGEKEQIIHEISRKAEEDALRREIEERHNRAIDFAEQAHRKAKEANQEDELPEPEDDNTPEPGDDKSPTDEPDGIDDQGTAEEPQPTDAPEEEPQDDEPPAPAEDDPEPTPPEEPPAEDSEDTPPAQPEQPTPSTPDKGEYVIDAANPYNGLSWDDMVDRMLRKNEVSELNHVLNAKIMNDVPSYITGTRFRAQAYRNNDLLVHAVEYCFFVKNYGSDNLRNLIRDNKKDGSLGKDFVRWLLTDKNRPLHRLLQAFKLNDGDKRNIPHAISTLYNIWKTTSTINRTKYLNLALACSLVHPDILSSPGERHMKATPLTIIELYRYHIKRDTSGKSRYGSVRNLSVSNLLHVVNARLPLTELQWAAAQKNLSRDKWGTLYESIRYRKDRAINDENIYKEYTFNEIRLKGGVCRDQAYFTANTAKSVGIPAAIITGDGSRGLHAWVAYMPNDKKWESVASYKYNTGYFINPCSNKPQHESDLIDQDKRMTEEKMEPAADLMLLSDHLRLQKKANEALIIARHVCDLYPRYITAWRNCIDIQKTLVSDAASWMKLRDELNFNSAKNSELVDLAQEIEVNYLLRDMRPDVKLTTLKRGYKKLINPITGRISLLLDCIKRQADVYMEMSNKRGLVSFYRQCFRDHSGRGDIFLLIVQQCTEMLEGSDKEYLDSLAKEAEKAYSRNAYKGSDDFKSMKDAEVMKAIAKLYFKATNDKKGIALEAEAEKKLNDISKKAD